MKAQRLTHVNVVVQVTFSKVVQDDGLVELVKRDEVICVSERTLEDWKHLVFLYHNVSLQDRRAIRRKALSG